MASVGTPEQQTPTSRSETDGILGLFHRPALLTVLLIAATVALYYSVYQHPFINFDDNDYVYANPHVRSGLSWTTVKWALTTNYASNWHPVTWLAHATDCQLFGLQPGAHHEINLLLHVLNVILLFLVLLRATGYVERSFMVAALFALHPVNVETVAWVAELKTLLSTMFFLLALGAYEWYSRRLRWPRMGVVACVFAVGLMAKPQIITLPFVLLLWDYWPLCRISLPGAPQTESAGKWLHDATKLVVEKTPLFALAAASALITMHAQHGARSWYPHITRVGNAILSYGLYIKNAVWPSSLILLYPHPGTHLQWWKVAVSAAVLSALTIWVIAVRRYRFLPVGWFWFLGTLVPMLGVVQVGVQAMADRYAYISFIGLFLMICWGTAEFARAHGLPLAVLPAMSVIVLLALGAGARHQLDYWKVEEALWQHALDLSDRNWEAESEMGAALAMHGRISEALPHFRNALAVNPDDTNSNLGIAMSDMQQGNLADAIQHFQVIVRQPTSRPFVIQQSFFSMAKAYRSLGDHQHSEECLRKARSVSVPQ